MYDEGPHIVLRRDGVCIVAKTPDGDMPQIEYWGRDFAFDTAGHARNLISDSPVRGGMRGARPHSRGRPPRIWRS